MKDYILKSLDYIADEFDEYDPKGVKYIEVSVEEEECDLCGSHAAEIITIHLKDGRFLIYNNEDPSDRSLYKVGKNGWLITYIYDLEHQTIFSAEELDSFYFHSLI